MVMKLVKHELKSSSKTLFPAIIASFIITVLFFLSSMPLGGNSEFAEIAATFLAMFMMIVLLAGGIAVVQYIISSLTKRVFGREGYLTLTLPANSVELLVSRIIVAFIWIILIFIIAIFGMFLILYLIYSNSVRNPSFGEFFSDVGELVGMIFEEMNVPLAIFTGILSIFSFIATAWVSISISNTKYIRNNRGVFSVGIYIVLGILMGVIKDFVLEVVGTGWGSYLIYPNSYSMWDTSVYISYVSIILDIIFIAVFFVGTIYILNKKLEIE